MTDWQTFAILELISWLKTLNLIQKHLVKKETNITDSDSDTSADDDIQDNRAVKRSKHSTTVSGQTIAKYYNIFCVIIGEERH